MKQLFLLGACACSLFASGSVAAVVSIGTVTANDSHIATEVTSKLARDVYISELPISVSSADGVVVISGWVADVFDEARIIAVTYGVNGVIKVDNKLKMLL